MPDVHTGVPAYRTNIYSTDAIVDPYPHYTAMRRLGPVVWLSKHRAYALPRYTECKAVLRDDKVFISGRGVALNPLTNRLSRGTTLSSDGAEHDQRASSSRIACCPGRCAASTTASMRRAPGSSTPR
jgi:cytochrome P450